MRPRAILLTGAPGTGKSTLGRSLAGLLRLPFIARDDIRGGLVFSAGAWSADHIETPSGDAAVERFLQTVEGLLVREVSCVVESVVRSHRPADFDRLRAVGDCVVIFTSCQDPTSRLIQRNETDRLIANPSVLAAAGARTVGEHTAAMIERMREAEREMRREFPVPVLHVDTTFDLEPSLEAVIAFATASHSRGESGSAAT
ncbi:MAG: AAA family ATPase [Ilumatobacteraceae bacterium]